MKKLTLISALLVCISSFGQEQLLNGISLNAPNGFVKTGNLQWNNGNENVLIQSIEGSYAVFKDLQSGAKLACKKASRASTFVDFGNLEVSGETYGFCLQKGQNTLALTQTYVYRDGYVYVVQVSADPDDYKRCFEILGYMITRITTEDYSNAIEPNPDADTTAKEYFKRATGKENVGDFYGAIKDYTKSIELNPNNYRAFSNRGLAKDQLEDFYGAIADYDMSIKIKPDEPTVYFNKGRANYSLKNYSEAIENYNKTIELDGYYADAYFNRGLSEIFLGNFGSAIIDFNFTIKLRPEYAEAYINRGVARLNMNNKKGACEDAERAQKLGYDASQLTKLACD